MQKKILLLFLFFNNFFGCIFATELSDADFLKSFVHHYEFNAEGRYAHEYHPALLGKTACSLDGLEEYLSKQNFDLKGRLVICGYEEQAVPSYYTDYKKAKIDDEASSKNKVGWSMRLHNRFGFITGFLFKDFNYFAQRWFKNKPSLFQHIDPDEIEIFDDRATIFQDHAFGQALDFILPTQQAIVSNFQKENYIGIFEELIKFWTSMYNGEVKVGNKQVAGTQDILFSIEYARHLVRSKLPLFKCYVGPDITYPIEVSAVQSKDATLHAQEFMRIFSQKLTPQEDKATVYIFCSFVDGVGKSTMLGNIRNYLNYGSDIERFDRVDNSSSQLADIFKLKENVFIADLPAQVSHFTYKPDGLVYVSAGRDLSEKKIKELQNFATQNKDLLILNYKQALLDVKKIINEEGFLTENLNNTKNIQYAFLRNLVLLKKEQDNYWVPFCKDGEEYLFNCSDCLQIRQLVPLGIVHSEGLKNIESEQMLFFDGIRLPMPYSFFLADLLGKLNKNNIEKVVFVDFISMYPRSSRENIRVNYLLQQMAFFDNRFDPKYSLYRDFVSDAELFALLKSKNISEKILESLKLETLVRLALFKIIVDREHGGIDGFSMQYLTQLIKQEIDCLTEQDLALLKDITEKKLDIETYKLEMIYGFTKNYVNIQQFSFKHALLFSQALSDYFYQHIDNERLNILWEDCGQIVDSLDDESGATDKIIKTDKGDSVRVLYVFDPECKNEHKLAPFLKTLRSVWYAALANIFDAGEIGPDQFLIEKEKYFVPPVFLKQGIDGKIYLVQKEFEPWDKKLPDAKQMCETFHISTKEKALWGEFKEKPYRLDWRILNTNTGLFAFDCDMSDKKKSGFNKSISTFLVQEHQKECSENLVISTSQLYEKLEQSALWKKELEDMRRQAQSNGVYKKDAKTETKQDKAAQNNYYGNSMFGSKNNVKIFQGNKEQEETIKLLIRMLVTLETVIKDPEADIVVRFGDRQDFAAALKLFEKITLPKYFGILFKQDLFDDYDYVEPFPSIEFQKG